VLKENLSLNKKNMVQVHGGAKANAEEGRLKIKIQEARKHPSGASQLFVAKAKHWMVTIS
jgi:hypothetical protein